MSKFSRDKGKRWEQRLARIYRSHGYLVSRNSNQAHQDAQGDDPKGDLIGLKAGPFDIHVQGKNQESLSIWAALRQAESEAPDGYIPTVHFTRNHHPSYVALPLGDFLSILDALSIPGGST